MKKAIFFNPYLETLGGGERYFLTLASCLAKAGWQVDIYWPAPALAQKASEKFGLDLKRVNFVRKNLSKVNLLEKKKITSQYDLSFYISDGSIPWLFSKRNVLHFQVPFHGVRGKSLKNKAKLRKINAVVCNSYFTKSIIDGEFGVKSTVIYPPIPISELRPLKKENIIVSVGRFTDLLHNKRQDVLVEAFKKLDLPQKSSWRLILAGSDQEGKKLVKKLKKQSAGFPIEVKTNLSFADLKTLYGQAKIFWTATGFGLDEEKHPEKMEHFGITTVEAMASGCVPVVIKKGGQKEIVNHEQNGLLWQASEELVKLTRDLINSPSLLKKLSKAAMMRSQTFSQKSFCENYEKITRKNH
jgi:glycosyltransferase involved in cell wall biosynthesis